MTVRDHVKELLRRIEKHDTHINAVIETNPDALDIAANLDQQNSPRGILHGVPVLLKDNIDTADAMLTTAGSIALSKAPSPADAPLVAHLREAGAVAQNCLSREPAESDLGNSLRAALAVRLGHGSRCRRRASRP